jgi:hypothetical protein
MNSIIGAFKHSQLAVYADLPYEETPLHDILEGDRCDWYTFEG